MKGWICRRQVTWKNLLPTMLVSIVPIIAGIFTAGILITYYWVIADDMERLVEILRQNLSFRASFQALHYSVYIFFGYILVLVLVSSFYIIDRYKVKKNIIRNIYRALLYMFIFGILFYLAFSQFSQASIYYMAIPLTYLLSSYFQNNRSAFVKEFMVWILIATAAFVQINA